MALPSTTAAWMTSIHRTAVASIVARSRWPVWQAIARREVSAVTPDSRIAAKVAATSVTAITPPRAASSARMKSSLTAGGSTPFSPVQPRPNRPPEAVAHSAVTAW